MAKAAAFKCDRCGTSELGEPFRALLYEHGTPRLAVIIRAVSGDDVTSVMGEENVDLCSNCVESMLRDRKEEAVYIVRGGLPKGALK